MSSVLSRRDVLKLSAAGVLGTSMSGWLPILAARAAQAGVRTKSCVLLWMDGGPSHKDTFDLRPATEHGGPFHAIQTSAPGIRISEHFAKLAPLMHHGAIIRSMSTGEGAHGRAKYFLHTGYREGVGGLEYPSIGALCSRELGRSDAALPNYVSIGNRSYGAGYLGARHAPLNVADPARGVENLRAAVASGQLQNRLSLLEELEACFDRTHHAQVSAAHRTTYQGAVTLMERGSRVFDINRESAIVRDTYGRTPFGQSCLLARRLVEAGVTFVEVTLGGWDTHQSNFSRTQQLTQIVDPAMSRLVADLHDRGLLDSTLVIWMGDFGRTPRINGNAGRDHYPRAWSTVLMGGGIRGGQVIGRTDADAATVVERPVSTTDFMATVCRILGMDYTKMIQTPIGRPIRIVENGANPISGLI